MKAATVTTHYIHTVYGALIQSGFSAQEACLTLNIAPNELQDIDRRIPIQRLADMWKLASEKTQQPLLGLLTGSQITHADYGIIGHMALTSDNLMYALETGLRYEHLINDAYETDLLDIDDDIINRLECNTVNSEDAAPLIELDFAALINFARSSALRSQLDKVRPAEVHFKHSPRGDESFYEKVLWAPVKFNQQYNQVIIPKSVLAIPTCSPDKSLLEFIMQKMHHMNERYHSEQQNFAHDVAVFITEHFPEGIPDANQTADHFGISTSTLKRRLSKERASFQAILTNVKKDLATSLIEQQTPISDIAMILGFSETAAFTRAYKKWTGSTPSSLGKAN